MSIDLIRWKVHIPGFINYFLLVGVFCLLKRKIFFTFDINLRHQCTVLFGAWFLTKEIVFLKTEKKFVNIIFVRNCRFK